MRHGLTFSNVSPLFTVVKCTGLHYFSSVVFRIQLNVILLAELNLLSSRACIVATFNSVYT